MSTRPGVYRSHKVLHRVHLTCRIQARQTGSSQKNFQASLFRAILSVFVASRNLWNCGWYELVTGGLTRNEDLLQVISGYRKQRVFPPFIGTQEPIRMSPNYSAEHQRSIRSTSAVGWKIRPNRLFPASIRTALRRSNLEPLRRKLEIT